jgi:hypothetical protein
MNSAIGWLVYIAFLAALIVVGWDEPLAVHFMSNADAAALKAQGQGAAGHSGEWMQDTRRWDNAGRAPVAPLSLPTPPPQQH